MKRLKKIVKILIAYTAQFVFYINVAEYWRERKYRNYIRMVSYHDTPPSSAKAFEKHLRHFFKYYHPATWEDIEALVRGEEWPHQKPGIIFSFDDGSITNYTVAVPLLEKYGFTGVFLIVPDWIDCPIEQQAVYAEKHNISSSRLYSKSPQLSLSWEQVLDLIARGHKIASHTRTHSRFSAEDTADEIENEVLKSKQIISRKTGPVDLFSWVGGELFVYQKSVYQEVQKADYRYTLTTCAKPIVSGTHSHFVGRTALTCQWPVPLVRLVLLPWYDENYRHKENLIRECFGLEARGEMDA